MPAGEITFAVENVGGFPHEFIVVELEPGTTELPRADDRSFLETGDGFRVVGKIAEKRLTPTASESLETALEPGSYVLLCNIVRAPCDGCGGPVLVHFSRGMHTDFRVA